LNRSAVDFIWYRATHDWTGLSHPGRLVRRFRDYQVSRSGSHYSAKVLGADMRLTIYHLSNLLNELESWEQDYLPVSVDGKVVLSVGDGCGETSLFYLRHGAAKVIAIEKDRESFGLLRENVERNGLNVLPINESFRLEHLKMAFDFMKIDVEGGEHLLLELGPDQLKPCVMEAHRFSDRALPEKLRDRFGMRTVACNGRNAMILTNVPAPSGRHASPQA